MKGYSHRALIVAAGTLVLAALLAAGCSPAANHDTSSTRRALIGHWQVKDTESKKIASWDDIYFSKTTVSYAEGTGQASAANRYQSKYTITFESSNPAALGIKYAYQSLSTGKQTDATKTLVFSSDKNSFTIKNNTDTREVAEETGPYVYAGPETAP